MFSGKQNYQYHFKQCNSQTCIDAKGKPFTVSEQYLNSMGFPIPPEVSVHVCEV